MQFECEECVRLWQDYFISTTEHVRLDGKLKLAALARADDWIMRLTPQLEDAAARRKSHREALLAHEQAAHPKQAKAAAQ
jgi:hypothetical protein